MGVVVLALLCVIFVSIILEVGRANQVVCSKPKKYRVVEKDGTFYPQRNIGSCCEMWVNTGEMSDNLDYARGQIDLIRSTDESQKVVVHDY